MHQFGFGPCWQQLAEIPLFPCGLGRRQMFPFCHRLERLMQVVLWCAPIHMPCCGEAAVEHFRKCLRSIELKTCRSHTATAMNQDSVSAAPAAGDPKVAWREDHTGNDVPAQCTMLLHAMKLKPMCMLETNFRISQFHQFDFALYPRNLFCAAPKMNLK